MFDFVDSLKKLYNSAFVEKDVAKSLLSLSEVSKHLSDLYSFFKGPNKSTMANHELDAVLADFDAELAKTQINPGDLLTIFSMTMELIALIKKIKG